MRTSDRTIMVTGCAGFIGSHFTEALLEKRNKVIGIDDLSAGRRLFMAEMEKNPSFQFIEGDLLSLDLERTMQGADMLCHFAANPDVRIGATNTRAHFDQNIEVTYRLLEAGRKAGIKDILFPSTSTVYGETNVMPTPESYGPMLPISIYGASKMSCEALISAYCHNFDQRAVIYRFANVVGPRSTHNVLHDFLRKLKENPSELEILGAEPGTSKSYIHVKDCVTGILIGAERSRERVEIYNIGSKDRLSVKEIADIVVDESGLSSVRYRWTGGVMGGRGWVGDVKQMLLSVEKLEGEGWHPSSNSAQAIRTAVKEIIRQRN